MIAIDTNVLLRYLLGDEPGQSARARKVIADNAPVLITDVSLVETVWTLTGGRYKLNGDAICRVLRYLVGDDFFNFESRQVVWASLRDYENFKISKGKQLDFADALIVNKAKYHGEVRGHKANFIYSFDKAVAQLDGARVP